MTLLPSAWIDTPDCSGMARNSVALAALSCLAVLGAVGAGAGGAGVWRSVVRVTFWGAAAMALTAGIGRLFGAVV
mgnify:CR=1 FL=1